MIAFHRVGLEYPRTKTKALYNVNLEIKKGEFVYVVGHSGAGKSTLLALILRRLVATQGAVYFAGQNLKPLRGDQVAYHRRRIGMVFQDHRLLSDMTVEENLAFVLQVQGVEREVLLQPGRLGLGGLLDVQPGQPVGLQALDVRPVPVRGERRGSRAPRA